MAAVLSQLGERTRRVHAEGSQSSLLGLLTPRTVSHHLTPPFLLFRLSQGTTYTIANMEHMTNHTTATNYAIEALSDVLHPLNPGFDAPFLFSPHLAIPNFVLTKSHCTGYCDNCPYIQDVQTVYSFEKGCRIGVVNADCGQNIIKPYRGIDDVHKLVHLVRSPFDNLVSRMHLGVQQRREGKSYPESLLTHFTNTPEGLLAWCDHVDAAFATNPDGPIAPATKVNAPMGASIDSSSNDHPSSTSPSHLPPPDLWERLRNVPCHSEIFRYVQFHNLAVEMAEDVLRLESPVHFLHYEDYSTDLHGTSRSLAAYLEQPVQQSPLPFIVGKTYGSLWTHQHRQQVTELIRYLATPTVWALLQRYTTTTANEEEEEPEKEQDEPRNKIAPTHLLAPSVTVRSGRTNRTELVWFLSFPQSGSFMFMNNLIHMSRIKAASHYYQDAEESVVDRELVWPDDPLRSPFVLRSSRRKKRKKLILTRNHCAGGCLTCKPIESFEAFDLNCRTVPAEGNVSHLDYHLSRVRDYWLLVRNPFDVIRSRINRGIVSPLRPANLTKDDAWDLQNTHLALERWCPITDQAYRDDVVPPPPPPSSPLPAIPHPSTLSEWATAAVQGLLQRQAACPTRGFASSSSSSSSHQEARRYSRLTHNDNKAHMEFHLNRTWIQQNYDDLPCFSEWVRIAQWYNYALELTQPHRTLPRRIVRFEEYNNNVRNNRTSKLQDLVRALGVEPVVPPLPFDAPRARHRMLYTHAQARRAKQLFRQVASVETWNLFRPYFENQPWNTVGEEANEGVVVTG